MAEKKESFFWTSYSDLMTSLFFVILVLFVLSLVLVRRQNIKIRQEGEATKAQLAKIQELNKSIEQIDPNYFEYVSAYKRHTLKNIQVKFNKGSSDINDLSASEKSRLVEAGKSIQQFMSNAKNAIPDAEYLLIIEGQSSKDNYSRNNELSYERALALVNMWKKENITFDNLPCEVIISGSGQNSRFRVSPDIANNWANQRFVIHIIPKPGVIGGSMDSTK